MSLRSFTFFLSAVLICSTARAQVLKYADWAWIKGKDTVNLNGIYGTRGVPAPANNPGGRDGAGTWTDTAGNFWLFGGEGKGITAATVNRMSDLWRYNPASNEWTWMHGDTLVSQNGSYGIKGVSSPTNKPGCRYRFPTWTDANGDLWLFGGYGRVGSKTTNQYMNDLWKYSVAAGEWTWVSGDSLHGINGIYGTKRVTAPTSKPGGRDGSCVWMDKDGNFWMFGGLGKSASGTGDKAMNDMWKYNVKDTTWTWMHGDSTHLPDSVYGVRGVSSPNNKPAARRYASNWTDAQGNFWLFGGQNHMNQSMNDLWKYDPLTNEWTWMHGDSAITQFGKYGTIGVAGSTNTPGARISAAAWQGPDGYFWMCGGSGYAGVVIDNSPFPTLMGYLNDLWLYDVANNEWTWVNGDSVFSVNGIYGTQGVTDPANKPGTRYLAAGSWTDAQGSLWMFGGSGRGRLGTANGRLSDMWKLENCFFVGQSQGITGDDTVCRQSVQTYTIDPAAHADAYEWTLPAGWTGSSNSETITVTAGNTGGTISVRAASHCDTGLTQTLDVFVPVFTPVSITADSFILGTTIPYDRYQWYKNGDSIPGARDSVYTVTENAIYTVVVTDIYGCSDSSTPYGVNNIMVPSVNGNDRQIRIYPNPAGAYVNVNASMPVHVSVQSQDGRVVIRRSAAGMLDIGHLPGGVYVIRVTDTEGALLHTEKLVKITP